MKETNSTEQLFDSVFRETLSNVPGAVPPGAWEGIATSLGHTAAASSAMAGAAAVKTAIGFKIAIALAGIAAVTALGIWMGSGSKTESAVQEQTGLSVPAQQRQSTQPETTRSETAKNTEIKPETARSDSKPEGLNKPVSESGSEVNADPVNPSEYSNYGHTGTFQFRMPDDQTGNPNDKQAHESNTNKTEGHSGLQSNTAEAGSDGHEVPAADETAAPVLTSKTDSSYILIPDAFTPDGDGINDVYNIVLISEERFEMIIYTATDNQIVFRSKNKYQGWNGKLPNGELAVSGTYFVKVIYKFKDKKTESKVVRLTLIR